MRSVRLEPELESRLEEAARITGEPVSELIRKAVRRRCDEVLGGRLDKRLADVIGLVNARGKAPRSARRTGRDFLDLVTARSRAKRMARPRRRSPE